MVFGPVDYNNKDLLFQTSRKIHLRNIPISLLTLLLFVSFACVFFFGNKPIALNIFFVCAVCSQKSGKSFGQRIFLVNNNKKNKDLIFSARSCFIWRWINFDSKATTTVALELEIPVAILSKDQSCILQYEGINQRYLVSISIDTSGSDI